MLGNATCESENGLTHMRRGWPTQKEEKWVDRAVGSESYWDFL